MADTRVPRSFETELQEYRHAQRRYVSLVALSFELQEQRKFDEQAKALLQAVALRADDPIVFYNLGTALHLTNDNVKAAKMFWRASELYQPDTCDWADAVACAFNALHTISAEHTLAEADRPEWWADGVLKELSARVVSAAPVVTHACSMRAVVLASEGECWEAAPRNVVELKEAVRWLRHACLIKGSPIEEEPCRSWASAAAALETKAQAAEDAVNAQADAWLASLAVETKEPRTPRTSGKTRGGNKAKAKGKR